MSIFSWESGSLFPGYGLAPFFVIFFQSQSRSRGSLDKSCHVFEYPGGLKEDGTGPRLENLEFQINGVTPSRYFSTHQNTIETDQLKRYYLDLFRCANSYYTNTGFDLTYDDYQNFWTIFPFSTTATGKNLADEIPLTKSGIAKIRLTFNEAPLADDLQQMYILAIYPSLMTIDGKRKIELSFRTS